MRILQVARLSRLGDEATGIEKQDEAVKDYARRGNHGIVGVAADTDVSGDTDPWSRPKLGPWLSDPLLIAQYDAIVAAHVDRLARNTVHFMRLLHWADEHGIRVITIGEQGIDFASPIGKLLGYIIAWLGEQELSAITRRSTDTQKWLRANGYLTTKPPFGYMGIVDPENNHKTLGLNPETSPLLREAIARYLSGETLVSIAQWLAAEGYPISMMGLRGLFRNPILIGKHVSAKTGKTLLRVEPILDRDTWAKLQAKVSAPKPRGAKRDPSLLSPAVLKCALCGEAMYHETQDGGRHYYRCGGKRDASTSQRTERCRNLIPADALDAWATERMTDDVLGTQEVLERTVVAGHDHADAIEVVEDKLRDLDFDAPDFLAAQATLLAERANLRELPAVPDSIQFAPTGETFADVWSRGTTAERRAFLEAHSAVIRARVVTRGWRGRPAEWHANLFLDVDTAA
jgi:DNA invertase Pin-like site-specific DNA recombinase